MKCCGTWLKLVCELQMGEEMTQEKHMLKMLRSEKHDLENEVCRLRVMKAKLLQQIVYARSDIYVVTLDI